MEPNRALRVAFRRALIDELNEDKTSEDGEKKLRAYERTSLNSSILLFKKFLANLEASWKHKKIAASGNYYFTPSLRFCFQKMDKIDLRLILTFSFNYEDNNRFKLKRLKEIN